MSKATKLPSGRWRARAYDYTDKNGKRHYVSFTADTKQEAQIAARSHIPSGGNLTLPYPSLTLREAYQRFIDTHTDTLSPATIGEYTRAGKRDFPNLMPMKLKDITPELVQTAVNEAARRYAPKTVRDKHGLLHKVLRLYAPHIVLNTDLPKRVKTEVYVPTSEEVSRALAAADEIMRVPILLASQGSLRREEICALTPSDVTDTGVIVNKAMVKDKDNRYIVKPPKTEAGNRFCPLPPAVIKEARAWSFSLNIDSLEKRWQTIKKNEGLAFKFHAFRHYWASLLHAKGVPDQYIAKIGGWSSPEMLHKVYAHALRDKTPAFSAQIISVFSNEFKSDQTKNA